MEGGSSADWCNTMGHGGSGTMTEEGPNHPNWEWGWGPQVLTATQAPPPVNPGTGRAHTGRCWCRRQPPSTVIANAIITATTTTSWGPRVLLLHATKLIEWHTKYVQTLSWWEELVQVPDHMNYQEFAWKVHASFEVLAAYSWVKMENYYTPPPAHPSIRKHCFLPMRDVRFACQDICLSQAQHTITYMKDMQCWAEWVHSPIPHHLAESMQDLQQVIELLCLFGRGRDLHDHGAIQLDGSYLTTVDGDHDMASPGTPKAPHPQHQSPSETTYDCDLKWR